MGYATKDVRKMSEEEIIELVVEEFGDDLMDEENQMAMMLRDIIRLVERTLDDLSDISKKRNLNGFSVMMTFLGYCHGIHRTSHSQIEESGAIAVEVGQELYKKTAEMGMMHALLRRYLDIVEKQKDTVQ